VSLSASEDVVTHDRDPAIINDVGADMAPVPFDDRVMQFDNGHMLDLSKGERLGEREPHAESAAAPMPVSLQRLSAADTSRRSDSSLRVSMSNMPSLMNLKSEPRTAVAPTDRGG
jgi:hypothetical protein